ncbi:carbohydrate ABC transporter permease [Actinospica sp.]|jgi:multiple sugar transport system permease protein|uniref:carbohydrate ABC transporter permease n=1 Tax=Actinospica sp. TaxID=1872142 RepID=UPI002CB8764C|nr:carbohydrate ABC transporter permease [Actinospica sp.]HWG23057.1 carbohydrate ABC transporter permease [Actinospica sp.]
MSTVTRTAGIQSRRRPSKRSRRALGTVAGVVIVAIMLFPLYWMLDASFLNATQLVSQTPTWFPLHGTLAGYRAVLSSQGGHLLVSLIVSLGTVAVTLLISAPAAYGMAKLRVPGRRLLLFSLLVAQMIPGIVMANSFYIAANDLGLLNSPIALILADSTLAVPFATLILHSFLRGVPDELGEAAAIDGASRLRTFVSVILPVARNAVITAGLFSFLFAWADFLFAVTLTTQDNHAPITVGIYRYIGANLVDWNSVMATGVIASIPAALLLIIAQRYVAAGIGSAATKD